MRQRSRVGMGWGAVGMAAALVVLGGCSDSGVGPRDLGAEGPPADTADAGETADTTDTADAGDALDLDATAEPEPDVGGEVDAADASPNVAVDAGGDAPADLGDDSTDAAGDPSADPSDDAGDVGVDPGDLGDTEGDAPIDGSDVLLDGAADVFDADVFPDGGGDSGMLDADLGDVGSPCGFPSPVDDGRYDGLAELRDAALVQALHDLIDDHIGLSYDEARDRMYVNDPIDVNDDDLIEGVYTGLTVAPDGTRSPDGPAGEMTTEHSWPRSEGASRFPAEGDLHHLFPAISVANNQRGSLEFGEVSCGDLSEPACPWTGGGSRRGPDELGGGDVFQVRPVSRGNIARAHFYFSVRYSLPIGPAEETVLRRWHCEDPPDAAERARNDAIEVHQNNRNPFLDQPEWVDHIANF